MGKANSPGLAWRFSRPSTDDIEGRSSAISDSLLATQLGFVVLFSHNYSFLLGMSQCPWAAITKHHRLGGIDNRNSFSHSSSGQKPKIKVSAMLVPSENSEADSVLGPSVRFCGFAGNLWHS